MGDNAFTNVNDSAIETARNAELEAYRQRLIAYDANPQPTSPDYSELADVDQNADGFVWSSENARWESTSGGGGGSDLFTIDPATPLNGVTKITHSLGANLLYNSDFSNRDDDDLLYEWGTSGDVSEAEGGSGPATGHSVALTFGTAGTGSLTQDIRYIITTIDYTFSCYVQRVDGSGTAQLVAINAGDGVTEYASVSLPTGADWQLVTLTFRPTSTSNVGFRIRTDDTNASTWWIADCMAEIGDGLATPWSRRLMDENDAVNYGGITATGGIYGLPEPNGDTDAATKAYVDEVAITPSVIYPVEHEDAVWFWWSNSEDTAFAHSNESSGPDTYVDGVITSPTDGVLPVTTESWDIPNTFLVGDPTEASVGDRIIYLDEWWNSHFGIFVVVDTGSETTPWVIQRAADHQIENLLIPFAIKSRYGGVRSRDIATSESNMFNTLSIASDVGTALSPHSFALGPNSCALGSKARAEASNSFVVGNQSALGPDAHFSIAIGDHISSDVSNVIIIGSNSAGFTTGAIVAEKMVVETNPDIVGDVATFTIDGSLGAFFYIQIYPVESYSGVVIETTGLYPGRTIHVEIQSADDADATVTWPEGWIWNGVIPTSFDGASKALLTIITGNIVTWAKYESGASG